MSKSLLNKVAVLSVVFILVGCVLTNETEVSEGKDVNLQLKPTGVKALNQPQINELSPIKFEAPTAISIAENEIKPDEIKVVEEVAAVKKIEPIVKASFVSALADISVKQSQAQTFFVYKNETYKDAMSRWLNNADFQRIGFLLDVSEERILNRKAKKNEKLYSTLTDAIEHITEVAIAQDADMVKYERDNTDGVYDGMNPIKYDEEELSGEQSKDIHIEARLDEKKHEAIITSSSLPTVMFIVEEGNVKDNFLRLAEFYDWNAQETYYLGTNYRISFGFPIVTEEGNIKAALEMLLAPFHDLRGALVPSVRQIYVLKEKE